MDITPHLKHFADEHLKVHGKTQDARRYLKDCIGLWTKSYGTVVGRQMELHIKGAWGKEKGG